MKMNLLPLRPRQCVHKRSGQALILGSFFVLAFFAFAALSIDVGRLYLDKKKLQNATDASCLAGAMELPQANSSDTTYDTKARSFATANKLKTAEIDTVEVGHWNTNSATFIAGGTPVDSVRVAAVRTVNLAFGPVIGLKTLTVHAHSVAQAYASDSVTGIAMPWVIHLDTNTPPSLCQSYTLKMDDAQAAGMWTPPNTSMSGSEYRTRIEEGYEGTVTVGDKIEFVTGVKEGPNQQGVDYRIAQDPNSTCATVNNTSARLVVVPYVLGPLPTGSGGNQFLNVDGFAVFFLTSTNGKQIIGEFQNLYAGKSINRRPPTQTTVNTALLVE